MIRTPSSTYRERNRRTGRTAISVTTRILREAFRMPGAQAARTWPAAEVSARLGEVLVTALTTGNLPEYREQGMTLMKDIQAQLETWNPPAVNRGKANEISDYTVSDSVCFSIN